MPNPAQVAPRGRKPLRQGLSVHPKRSAPAPTGRQDDRYTFWMPTDLFEDMKAYVKFGPRDAEALLEIKPAIGSRLPEVVDVFYSALLKHPRARTVFNDQQQIERLKGTLLIWLQELFEGLYDESYFDRRSRIGRTHVRVGLPQHFMFTAMNVVRRALASRIEELAPPNRQAKLEALHKLLDLDLAIMNETYREDLLRRIQEIEHAQYQAQLSKAEHLAAVGELAASLAHEIKNPLAGISGAIQILGQELADDHPHKEIIAESLRQIDRLDAAVKDLLIYARPKPPVTAPVRIDQLLQRALVLLRGEPAFKDLVVDYDFSGSTAVVRIDESQIHQVFTNLLINAAHACRRGGRIVCRIFRSPGDVRIVVDDNGIGMSREVLGRAFEPFYTTKAKGTGLGLAICRRIVDSHGGKITLESEPGRGTRVTVELPDRP